MIATTARQLQDYARWARQLPAATGTLFAARTRAGRNVKILLFAVGVALPLGSLIWMLLYWHGRGIDAEMHQNR